MNSRKFQVYFFVSVLVLSLLLTLLVFRSYLVLLAFSGVVAILSRPLYNYIKKLVRSRTAASSITVLIVAGVVIMPLVYFFAALSAEVAGLFENIRSVFDTQTMSDILYRVLPAALHDSIPAILNEAVGVIRVVVEKLSGSLLSFFSNAVALIFAFLIVLISVYYLLKDGARLKKELLILSPLGDEYDELVFQKIIVAVRAVMMGVLVVGLIKGILAGLAYWIFGLPAPLFWGTMTGLSSFLPFLGTGFITIPAVLYLLLTGHIGAGIGLAIVSVALVGTIDNLLQPKLVEQKTKIHPLLILLSILGGIQFYGFAGFMLGPLTLAVAIALIDIYKKDFRRFIQEMNGRRRKTKSGK